MNEAETRWTLAAFGASLLVFLSTFSTHVALGDSPESVAGIKALGILHAPGYPVYVIAARIFSTLLPFGSMAMRVNLFSVVSAALTATMVFLIARKMGATRVGALAGALTLATGTSFWFYAGFAKHYAFSAFLLAATTYAVLAWRERGGWWRLGLAGAVLGAATGGSWQIVALLVPALAWLVLVKRPLPRVRDLGAAVVAGVLAVVLVWGFVLVRAGQNPALDWGHATSVHRVVDLITLKDFGLGTDVLGRDDSPGKKVGPSDAVLLPVRLLVYLGVLSREVGWWPLLVGLFGLGWSWTRKPRVYAGFLTLGFLANLVGAALVVPPGGVDGFQTTLAQGGFLLGALLSLAVMVGLGVSAVEGRLAAWRPARPNDRAARRRADRRRRPAAIASGADLALAGGVLLALTLVVPSALAHWRPANHRGPSYADDYVTNVWSAIPARSVLLVWGTEQAFPFQHRQLAEHERTDIVVVNAKGLFRPWYQDELRSRLGQPSLTFDGGTVERAVDLVRQVRGKRPVYLDAGTAGGLQGSLGLRPMGLASEVTDGSGLQVRGQNALPVPAPTAAYRRDGVYDGGRRSRYFPNLNVMVNYEKGHLLLGRGYAEAGQRDEAEKQFVLALRANPGSEDARQELQAIRATR